jgi:hypothetical protein
VQEEVAVGSGRRQWQKEYWEVVAGGSGSQKKGMEKLGR